MALSRKFITVGAVGVAAFALIGAGASATFQDSVTAAQAINVGTLSLNIRPLAGSGTNVDEKTLSLTPIGPTASTFSTTPVAFQVNPTGDITAKTYQLGLSETNTDANLANLWVHITSHNPTASAPNNTTDVLYDGPISGFTTLQIQGDLTAANTATDYDQYEISFSTPTGFSLVNSDMGKSITPIVTVTYQG
jgi:hypothetical protein